MPFKKVTFEIHLSMDAEIGRRLLHIIFRKIELTTKLSLKDQIEFQCLLDSLALVPWMNADVEE